MSEFVYGLNQRTGPRPIIRKIGAIAPDGMEQTPVIFKGAAYSVESAFANVHCPVQHIRVRNIKTGELSRLSAQITILPLLLSKAAHCMRLRHRSGMISR